jgi:hypothetical protein
LNTKYANAITVDVIITAVKTVDVMNVQDAVAIIAMSKK